MNFKLLENKKIINIFYILIFFIVTILLSYVIKNKLNRYCKIKKFRKNLIIDLSNNNLSENLIYNHNNEVDELPSYSQVYPTK